MFSIFYPKKNYFVVLVLSFLFFLNSNLYGQVSVYSFSQATSVYAPLSGATTTAYSGTWNDHVAGACVQATLPFSFTYDGTAFTQCYISPNGFITFGTTQPAAANYLPISDNTVYNTATTGGVVSALGINLKSGSAASDIKYGTEGTAPNRTFVIEWNDAERVGDTGPFDFQIRLSETTNVIVFSYGLCQPAGANNFTVQVGLRGPNNTFTSGNTINRLMLSSQTWLNNSIAGTQNNATMVTNSDAYPNNGLKYTFTPALPCAIPAAQPTNLVLGATGITDVTITGNSFTAASPAPTKYLVLRSVNNITPTSAVIANRTSYQVGTTIGAAQYYVLSASSALSFTQTGAAAPLPDTTYRYWVIPYNDGCQGGPIYNLTSILTGSVTTCSKATVTSNPTVIGGNGFTATWTAVAGAANYYIDVSTNPGFTAIVPDYSNLSVGNVTSLNVAGLLPVTTYYFRVRAQGIGCLVNSNVSSATTTCGYYTLPYFENFDTLATGVVPTCAARVDANADGTQWQTQSVNFSSASRSMQISKNTTVAMNDWFFLPALNLTAGVSYRLFFRYNTGSSGTSEILKVFYGSVQNVAGMTNTLATMSPISNTVFLSKTIDFTPSVSGSFYIGFQGNSNANQTYIVIDDISVTVTPTCFEPSNISVSAITSTTATLSWTAASPAPSQGYQYYISTSGTPPTVSTTPTGSVATGNTASLASLSANTYYYVWVRGNCGAADKSAWSVAESFNTECIIPAITSITPVTRCGYGSATISASPNINSTVYWYDSPISGTSLATGTNFTTPPLSTTTTYYAEAKASGAISKIGPTSPSSQGGNQGIQLNQDYFTFTITAPTSLQSVDIYPMVSGQAGRMAIRNTSNVTLALFPYTTSVSGGATAQQLPINYQLQPGNYNFFFETMPASGLRMNTSNAVYPYTSYVAAITGNGTDFGSNLGCYNWKFTTECISPRIAVPVTVTTPPSLTLSASAISICDGTASSLVTVNGYQAYNTLTWSPNTGVSGSFAGGFTFNPTTTTTYYLTASQNGGNLCGNRASITITVLPSPPQVAIIPESTSMCFNAVQALNGSTSSSSPATAYSENFNSPTNNWVVQNTSFGGDLLASQWTLRPNNYNYISSFWNVTFSSNDASQFYLANADSQTGSPAPPGTVTRTTLTSPSISLSGYTTANLNFWHYVRYTESDAFLVQVSTNNGASWTTVKSYITMQGSATSFANAIINLDAYVGLPDVKIRFDFTSYWAYGWAIDNVSVTGTLSTALTWSPITNLYTNSQATIPYVANMPLSVVYAKPNVTTTYTATSTAANGCFRNATATITVSPPSVGGTTSGNQSICSGTPSDIILTGYVGDVIRWEYADNAAFTSNVTAIAGTTATLSAAQMGVFPLTRYFRAVVKSGSCNEAYSSVVSITFPTTVWNGAAWSNGVPNSGVRALFEGNYNSSGNLTACSVLVNSGAVVFNANHNLTAVNEVTVAGGSMTFENNSSLVQVNNVANSGNIYYKRTTTPIKRFDYTYWSTPVHPQTLFNVSPDTPSGSCFRYDQLINYWVSVPSNTVMDPARGYIIRAPQSYDVQTAAPFNATFYGIPNNGTISIPIVVNVGNYNLIGNPYPSALDINAFLSYPSNISKVDATVYLWTHNTPIASYQYTSNDYAVYNYLGSTGTSSAPNLGVNNGIPNGKIASGQSFFIKGLSNGDVTFTNSMRISGNNNQFFRMENPPVTAQSDLEKHRFWLDVVSPQGAYKQILVGYAETATDAIDRGFDGEYMDVGNQVAIYSLCSGLKLNIQGRALPFSAADEVPVGFKGSVAGDYQIRLYDFDGLFSDQDVFLKDTFLNAVHNLKQSAYTFHSEAGVFDGRFVVVYHDTTLGNPDIMDDNTVVIYKPHDKLIIDSGNKIMKSVKVFDIRGRLIFEKKDINTTETALELGAVNQVYMIQITTDDLRIINKKYVN